MRVFIIFCIIALIFAKKIEDEKHSCNGVYVRNKFHKSEVLGLGINRPYQLSYDQHDHRVYFSFNVGKKAVDTFEIGYLEKGSLAYKTIKSVENGFATTIDNKNGILYIGGSKGIFKKNLKANNSEFENVISNHNVWDMFFKDHLYFISYPSMKLYKIINKEGNHIAERLLYIDDEVYDMYQFVIDGDDDIFLTTMRGLLRIKNGTNVLEYLSGAPDVFRSMEVNNKGVAHFGGRDGIYIIDKNSNSVEEIASIKNLFGITFDSDDNLIYSDPLKIKKLLPEDCT